IDYPLMGVQPRYRTDVSITLFLNDPSEYEGGELCIKTPYGEKDFKLPAGSALLYPASSRHSVKEVKSGTRLVAVTWLQSMVRNPECREILFQLAKARDLLASDTESEAYKRVETGYANLVRLWADV
ncbi:MAG: Fe2+-dependent dioxygenase, partial [Pseudomonadota bacterium]